MAYTSNFLSPLWCRLLKFKPSLKYTKAGHVKIKIEEQTEKTYQPEDKGHSQVTITVTDTGIGISKDFLRYKLFTPFSQESAVAAGTGRFRVPASDEGQY